MNTVKAKELLNEGAILIDVRTVGEFESGHVKDAINIPLDIVRDEVEKTIQNKQTPLLLYCRSGARSGMATKILRMVGYENTHNIGAFHQAALLKL